MKILSKNERDFLVCSDCIYYTKTEIFNEKYPEITRGICSLHEKVVDNRWESKCKDNTGNYVCKNCQFFDYDEHNRSICTYYEEYTEDSSDVCNEFDLES